MKHLISDFRVTPAIIALLMMNLFPLIGVFFFGWNVGMIVFLYWLENVIIGLLNIPKILACGRSGIEGSGRRPSTGGLAYLCVFFAFHYGAFCAGHYFFLQLTYRSLPEFTEIFSSLFSPVLFWSLFGLTLSHVISMFVNFYGKGEFKIRSANKQMFIPYSRIVLLHIVIILSGFFALAVGQGLATLLLLVVLKIIFDLAAHIAEHSKKDSLIAPSAN